MSRRSKADEDHYAGMSVSLEQWRAEQERERSERRARQLIRDMEYRRALGLDVTAELPKELGTAGGGRNPIYSRVRGSKRMTA